MERVDDSKLPSEIICLNILPRLPRESLMRFRCVCKSWKTLLTANPVFRSIHLNFHPHNSTTHLLLDAYGSSDPFVIRKHYLLLVKASQEGTAPSHVTDLVTLPDSFINMRYANGLVLGYFGRNDPIYIFNPFTRESIIVPSPTPPVDHYLDLYFGFSPSTNEYKVVHMATQKTYIAALDIGEERFRIIRVPSELVEEVWRIIEVDGCLCIVSSLCFWRMDVMLWILKDYEHQVWVKEPVARSPPEYPASDLPLEYRASDLPLCTIHTVCNHINLADK
ncbi:putative F-box protein At3g16210 [Rosa rugosa]|uniref:putative F-box protein At3g16210 n=1 Tax=Rosa rugosa TaxID=74645 RepID=UPI002B40B632|nr:putative F-box protein At3g16210 [Rosa rugosa]